MCSFSKPLLVKNVTGKFDGAKTFDQPAKYLFSSMGKAKVRLVAGVIKITVINYTFGANVINTFS